MKWDNDKVWLIFEGFHTLIVSDNGLGWCHIKWRRPVGEAFDADSKVGWTGCNGQYVGIKLCPVYMFFWTMLNGPVSLSVTSLWGFFCPRIQWDTNSGASHKSVHNVTRDVVGRMWFWMPCRSSMIYLIPWRGVPWVFNATAPWWYLGMTPGLGGFDFGGKILWTKIRCFTKR